MSLPRLNRLMMLEQPVRSDDGAGGFTTTWQALGSVFADVKAGIGRQVPGQIGPLSRKTLRIVVRASGPGAPSRPKPGQRFREGSRMYRIDAVANYDRGAHYLVAYVVEEDVV